MKKLLSLLSVLTISGTAVPTTIAASSYKKQEKLNNKINYQQINNLESLKRSKRQNNNITPDVKVSYEINDYFSDLYNAIIFLQNNDNVRIISPQETGGPSSPSIFYVNENSNNKYFIIPINIENDRRISLIFRSNDFYLQGFIGHPTSNNNETLNVYYFFNDSTITNVSGTTSSQRMSFGSNYTGSNGLRADERAPIRWTGIVDAFHQLANYGKNPSFVDSDTLRSSFLRVILATTESMRFREVRNNIISNHDNDTPTSNWGWYFNNFLRNWDRISQEALNYLIQIGTLIGFNQLQNINIFSKTLSNNFKTCNRRNARDLNNNEYCFILPKKEFYFRNDKQSFEIINDWWEYDYHYFIKDFDLGLINIFNYKKLKFLGSSDDFRKTRISWSNTPYYSVVIGIESYSIYERNVEEVIMNGEEINYNNIKIKNVFNPNNKQTVVVQDLDGRYNGYEINLKGQQYFSLNQYKRNEHYYLQVLVRQRATCTSCYQAGSLFMNIGKGIIFYNN